MMEELKKLNITLVFGLLKPEPEPESEPEPLEKHQEPEPVPAPRSWKHMEIVLLLFFR